MRFVLLVVLAALLSGAVAEAQQPIFSHQFTGDFADPYGITVRDRIVWVADFQAYSIKMFYADGMPIRTVADDLTATVINVHVGRDNKVYSACPGEQQVSKMNGACGLIWFLRDDPRSDATVPSFNQPMAIDADQNGNVYIADTWNHRLQKFNSDAGLVAIWGSYGSGAQSYSAPRDLEVGPDSNIYVADEGNNRIKVIDTNGNYLREWTYAGGQYGPNPMGIGIDQRNGNVFVVDRDLNCVMMFSDTGNLLSTWGEYGQGDGQFDSPRDVAIDGDGRIFVVDGGNKRIQVFTQNPAVPVEPTTWGQVKTKYNK